MKDACVLNVRAFIVATSLEEAVRFGPFDFAIFALKSFDTAAALEQMKPFAQKLPTILCLSNGVENEQAIARVLGEEKVIHGTVTSAIGRRGPGDIVLEKLRGVGIAAGHAQSRALAAACEAAFLNCRVYPEPHGMKWSKLLTNLIANPTSAILDMTAAEVLAHPGLYRLEVDMLRECLAVMKAQRLAVTDLPGTPVRALSLAARLPLWISRPLLGRAAGGGRGGKMPSFHIDLHSGRGRSEVEFLHGAVVRAGARLGVPTPVNELLTKTLVALTRGEFRLDEFAQQPDKLLSLWRG
jgi:2-dehydropantoate 2-reductase